MKQRSKVYSEENVEKAMKAVLENGLSISKASKSTVYLQHNPNKLQEKVSQLILVEFSVLLNIIKVYQSWTMGNEVTMFLITRVGYMGCCEKTFFFPKSLASLGILFYCLPLINV